MVLAISVCGLPFFFGFAAFFGTIVLAGREWVRSESNSSKLRFWESWNNPVAQSYRSFFSILFFLVSEKSEGHGLIEVHPLLSNPLRALGSMLRSRVHPPLSGPSCALEPILRSWVHPPFSGPSCALEPILRSRVHPPFSGPSCALESILRSGVHYAI